MAKEYQYQEVSEYLYFASAVTDAPKYSFKDIPLIGDYYEKYVYNGLSEAYTPNESYSTPGKVLIELLVANDPDFTDYLFEQAKKLTIVADSLEEINFQDLKKGHISELPDFYYQYRDIFSPAIGWGYTLDFVLDDYARQHNIDTAHIQPIWMSFMEREKYALKKIFASHNQDELLADHVLRYSWLLNNYHGSQQLTVDYFKERGEEVANLPERAGRGEMRKPTSIVEWISLLMSARDERKRCNLIAISLLDRYLARECERWSISRESAVMLTVEEFEMQKKNFKSWYGSTRYIHVTNKGIKDLTKDEWNTLFGKKHQIETEQITGQIAFKGKISGKVKIILSSRDFNKLTKGDILIAPMTRPEYAPILSMCAAIVTDEGGITCHAAIVAREMKKPCIIGTKHATKIFKDGDVVEVDAEKGIVRKLD